MKSILVIAERELRTYFTSPIAYVVLTIFTFLAGFVFYFFVGVMVESVGTRAMMSAQTGRPPDPVDMPGVIVQNMFNFLSFVLLLVLPMITMALFSEEKKRGTMELLLTAPVTDLQVVLGKFLAASTFYLILLATTLVELLILFSYSQPAKGPILSAYLGIALYGLAIIAIGMFISTLTESQVISVILTFGVLMVLWLIDALARSAGPTAKAVLSYLSILEHTNDFLQGVISTSHIIFYLSFIVLGIFLTYRSLDSLRWRS
jgi:ABC-2 type transport system permease protein